jgi:hypothetical protein
MIPMRYSSASGPNTRLTDTAKDTAAGQAPMMGFAPKAAAEEPAASVESNVQWLRDTGIRDGIILLGGTSLAHFRLRVAQSQIRGDLLPSYWSLAGILIDGEQFFSVPLDTLAESSIVPTTNGVQICNLADYDDTTRFPNIAVLQFTNDSGPVLANVKRIRQQRSIIDLPTLILAWLGHIWAAGQQGNPLLLGMGMPSAAFTETAYGMAGVELTPGLSSAASCPEAIWQSAKFWHNFYEKPRGVQNKEHARGIVPTGSYVIRQTAAAALGLKDTMVGEQIVAREVPRTANEDTPEGVETTASEKPTRSGKQGSRKSGRKSSAKKRSVKSRK